MIELWKQEELFNRITLNKRIEETNEEFGIFREMLTNAIGVFTVDTDGNPVSGCVITSGSFAPVVSPDGGFCAVAATAGSVSVVCNSPIDYGSQKQTITVDCSDGKYHEVTFVIEDKSANYETDVTISGKYAFSNRVSDFDIFCLGAGGGGGAQAGLSYVSGGGGGAGAVLSAVLHKGFPIKVIIGAGGIGELAGNLGTGVSGGGTSVEVDGALCFAGGGGPGRSSNYSSPAVGVGGAGQISGPNGGNNSVNAEKGIRKFGDATMPTIGGGGGGCYYTSSGSITGLVGGSPGGASGGGRNNPTQAMIAKYGGGGGGTIGPDSGRGGTGGNGLASFRWRLK